MRFPIQFEEETAAFETGLVRAALAEARHNQKRAAELMGLTYHQFRGLLRKYRLLEENAET